MGGEVGHEDGAEHAGEEERADAEGAGVEAAGDVGGGDDGADGDGARGDGEEGGLFGGVAEAGVGALDSCDRVEVGGLVRDGLPLDDGSLETTDSPIRYTRADRDQTQHPRMWILQALHRLRHLPMLVLNARLVLPESLNRPKLLIACEAGFHRVVGEKDDDASADNDGDEAHEEEEDLPGFEGFGGVVLKAVASESANDSAGAGANVPEAYAEGLFWCSQ